MIVKCDFCNGNIKKIPSRITKNNFCNNKCKSEWAKQKGIMKKYGFRNPFYGKHHSEETKNKLRYQRSEETREKIRQKAIGRHHSDETKKKMSNSQLGEKNHAYIHGNSSRKYCYKFFGKDGVRSRSLKFFNNKCIECGKTKEQTKDNYLIVHHVYYRKMSCCEIDNDYENGIKKIGDILFIKDKNKEYVHKIQGSPEKFAVLCHSCHAKTTTHNRLFWIQHFERKINKEYNGTSFVPKCNLSNDIYLSRDSKNYTTIEED